MSFPMGNWVFLRELSNLGILTISNTGVGICPNYPIFFTLFATTYAFTRIKSDMISCVYGHSQTEPCHALFFVGMVAKFVCPVCYLMTKITFTEVKLDANKSKIIEYFRMRDLEKSIHLEQFALELIMMFWYNSFSRK